MWYLIGPLIYSYLILQNVHDVRNKISERYAAPIRSDRNGRGGGTILYIREDIPARLLTTSLPKNFDRVFVELNLRKKKILCAVLTILPRAIYLFILVFSGDHWIATCQVMIIF